MDDILYCFGYGQILFSFLNSVAIFFKSESNYIPLVTTFGLAAGGTLAYVKFGLQQNSLALFGYRWLAPTFIFSAVMVAPLSTIKIVDKSNPQFHASHVDNIPNGIVATFSVFSSFFYSLAEMIEHNFDSSSKSLNSGVFFGARLLAKAKDPHISNYLDRQNIMNFANRCYYVPFIAIPNSKTKEALSTKDIMGFISANFHKVSKTRWQNANGTVKNLSCANAYTKANLVFAREVPKNLHRLASEIFGSDQSLGSSAVSAGESSESDGPAATVNVPMVNTTIKSYMGDAYDKLAKHTNNASDVVKQQMLINSARLASDSYGAGLGLGRMNPEYVSMATTRTQSEQTTSWILKSDIAGSWMPMLQGGMIIMLMLTFILIIPLCFIPGCLGVLSLWVKLVIWVNSWTVFSSVLNITSNYWLQGAINLGSLTVGEGFTFASNPAIAEGAYNVYAWVSSLQLTVPVLSWMILSKSGYAITGWVQGMTSGAEGSAVSHAKEATDGNLALKNHQIDSRNYYSRQIAQQQLGASINSPVLVNDGNTATTYGKDGYVTINQGRSSLKYNLNSKDSTAHSLNTVIGKNEQKVRTNTESLSQSSTETANALGQWVDSVSNAKTNSTSYSEDERNEISTAYDQQKKAGESLSKKHGVSQDVVASFGAGSPIPLLRASLESVGRSSESVDKVLNSDEFKSYSKASKKLHGFAMRKDSNETDSATASKMKQYQESYAKTTSHQETLQNSITKGENLSKLQSLNDSGEINLGQDRTDEFRGYLSKQKGGRESADRLVSRSNTNRNAYYELNTHANNFQRELSTSFVNKIAQAETAYSNSDLKEIAGSRNLINNVNNNMQTLKSSSQANPTSSREQINVNASQAKSNYDKNKEERNNEIDTKKDKIDHKQEKLHNAYLDKTESPHAKNSKKTYRV